MKKTYRFALTMSALMAMLAACQPKNISQKNTTNDTPPTETVAETVSLPSPDSVRPEQMAKIQKLAQENNHFAADVYKRIAKPNENCFFSPYSISSALAMTYAGAKGKTAEQMQKAMYWTQPTSDAFHADFGDLQTKIDKSNSKKLITKVANRIWVDEPTGLVPKFVDQNTKYYGAGIEKINFGDTQKASAVINKWVESQTNDLIKDLLTPKNLENARMVLVNAIYFYGEWLLAFDEKESQNMTFTTSKGEAIDTKFMIMRSWVKKTADKTFKYTEDKDVQVLELPYEGNKSSMVVVLPKPNYSLAELIKDLDQKKMQSWQQKLSILLDPLNLYLPKWTTTQQFSVKETLMDMGMITPFSDGADFSGMLKNGGVKIGDVIHKAFIDVSEKGTEAAAATAVIMVNECLSSPVVQEINFVANRPFLYYIKDNATGSILFMGHINNPK
jgi:serine protease inhibitor